MKLAGYSILDIGHLKLAGYSILDIGHSNVQCPISNIRLTSRSRVIVVIQIVIESYILFITTFNTYLVLSVDYVFLKRCVLNGIQVCKKIAFISPKCSFIPGLVGIKLQHPKEGNTYVLDIHRHITFLTAHTYAEVRYHTLFETMTYTLRQYLLRHEQFPFRQQIMSCHMYFYLKGVVTSIRALMFFYWLACPTLGKCKFSI